MDKKEPKRDSVSYNLNYTVGDTTFATQKKEGTGMSKETFQKDKEGNIIIKEITNADERELPIIDEEQEKISERAVNPNNGEDGFKDVDDIINAKPLPKKDSIAQLYRKQAEKSFAKKQTAHQKAAARSEDERPRPAKPKALTESIIIREETKERSEERAEQKTPSAVEATAGQTARPEGTDKVVKNDGKNYEEWVYKQSPKESEGNGAKALLIIILIFIAITGMIFLPQILGAKNPDVKLDLNVVDGDGNGIISTLSVAGKQYNPETEIMLKEGAYNLEAILKGSPVNRIIMSGMKPTEKSMKVNIAKIDSAPKLKDMDVITAFTIASENAPSDTQFARRAEGDKVFFCEQWNSVDKKCDGGKWAKATDASEGEEYILDLAPGAYIEAKEQKIRITI